MHLGWELPQILGIGHGKFFRLPASILAPICKVLERKMYKSICWTILGRGRILMYSPQKVVQSRVTPQKMTPEFQLFWPFLPWLLGEFSPCFQPLLPCALTLSIEIWMQGSPNIGLQSHKISDQMIHVGLTEKPRRVANQMHFFRVFGTFSVVAPTCLNAVQQHLTPR